MSKKESTRTDLRIRRTRQLIKDAFVQLLDEMEMNEITVSKIAERATIHRVTFYSHYRDIPDLVNKIADEMADQLSAILKQTPDEPTRSAQNEKWETTVLVNLLEHIAKHASFYRVILGSKRIPIFRDRLLKLLTDMIVSWIDTKERNALMLNMGIKKDFLIWYASSALLGTITAWLQKDMPYTPSFLAKQFSILHQRGLKKDYCN